MIKNIFRICAILSAFLTCPSALMAANATGPSTVEKPADCHSGGWCWVTRTPDILSDCGWCAVGEYSYGENAESTPCSFPANSTDSSTTGKSRYHEYSCAWRCNSGTPYFDPNANNGNGACKEYPSAVTNAGFPANIYYTFNGNSDKNGDTNTWKQCVEIKINDTKYYVKYFTDIYTNKNCDGVPITKLSDFPESTGKIFDGFYLSTTGDDLIITNDNKDKVIKLFNSDGTYYTNNGENNVKYIFPDMIKNDQQYVVPGFRAPQFTIQGVCGNKDVEYSGNTIPYIADAKKLCDNNNFAANGGYYAEILTCTTSDGNTIESGATVTQDLICSPKTEPCPKGYYCTNLSQTPCLAGQTTDEEGASQLSDCRYTADTVFKYGTNGPTFKLTNFTITKTN